MSRPARIFTDGNESPAEYFSDEEYASFELCIGGDGNEPEPRRFLTAAQIEALPKPGYRIPDILVLGALVVLYGPPGSFKSFLALSWALSIATGFDWLGRP